MIFRVFQIPICCAFLVGLTGCVSSLEITELDPRNEKKEYRGLINKPFDDARKPLFSTRDFGESTTSPFPVNLFLWQASLETLSGIGIKEIDPQFGTIVSEWTRLDDTDRLQLTVMVLNEQLTSNAVTVNGTIASTTDSQEATRPASQKFLSNYKNIILSRAREMRLDRKGI